MGWTFEKAKVYFLKWSAIAVLAEDITTAIKEAVEVERRKKQSETKTGMTYGENLSVNKLTDKLNPERSAAVIAKAFNTNENYIYEAGKKKRPVN